MNREDTDSRGIQEVRYKMFCVFVCLCVYPCMCAMSVCEWGGGWGVGLLVGAN